MRDRPLSQPKTKQSDLRNTSLLNHCSHQYALVDVPIADGLHADPDDTRVGHLLVVDGQHGLRRRGRLRAQDQRGGAEVWMRGAAGGAGQTGRGGHGAGGEILCNVVERAGERLRRKYEDYVPVLIHFP